VRMTASVKLLMVPLSMAIPPVQGKAERHSNS